MTGFEFYSVQWLTRMTRARAGRALVSVYGWRKWRMATGERTEEQDIHRTAATYAEEMVEAMLFHSTPDGLAPTFWMPSGGIEETRDE